MKAQLRLAGGRRKLCRHGFSSDRPRGCLPPEYCATCATRLHAENAVTYAVRIEKMHPLAMAMLHYLVGASAMSAPAGLYSETARANLKYAIVTEPASTIAAKDESPRWQFRASGLVFSLIAKTPLYKKIKANAFAKMRVATESTGVNWDEEVAALEDVCTDERLDAIVAEAGPAFVTPAYYRRPFHAYDDGNLCWEHACHQPLVSRAVGARNLPGMAPAEGDENFRGAFDRELLSMLPDDAPARRDGASLLDLGCGTGISTSRLLAALPKAASCVGVDLSPWMLVIGRELIERGSAAAGKEADPRLALRLGDAACTGLPDACVDLVSLCLIMHELPSEASDAILAEAARVLKPNGHLAIFEMDPSSPGFGRVRSNPWVFAALRSTEPYLDDYFWKVAPSLTDRLAANGMQVLGKRLVETNKHQVVVAAKEA